MKKGWDFLNAPVIAAIVQCLVLIVGVVGYGFYDGQKETENLRYQRRVSAVERVTTDMIASLAALMELQRYMVHVHSGELEKISREKILDRYSQYKDAYNRRPCDSVLFGVKASVADCLDYKSVSGEKVGELIERLKEKVSMLEGMEFENEGEAPFSIKKPDGETARLTRKEALKEIRSRVEDISDDVEKLALLIHEAAVKEWSIW